MKIQRVTTEGLESPGLVASKLPPEIVDRAVAGLCWVSLFTAVTSILLTVIEHVLQPEFAKAWAHPVLRIASLFVVFLSVGFIVVQRSGWLRKERLLDLGMFFQVAVAFCCALFEGAAYENPNMVVLGHSGIAVWMMLCGLLMPNAPLESAVTAVLCVADVAAGLLGGPADFRLPADAAVADAGLGAAAGDRRASGCTCSTIACSPFMSSSSARKTSEAMC